MVSKVNVIGQWEKKIMITEMGFSRTVDPGLEQIHPFDNFSSYAVIGLFDKILAIVDYWSGCE